MNREELREVVERSRLTQVQFARALGVSQQFVSKMLRGKRPVPGWIANEALDFDPSLIEGADDPAVERQRQARETPAPRGPYRRRF